MTILLKEKSIKTGCFLTEQGGGSSGKCHFSLLGVSIFESGRGTRFLGVSLWATPPPRTPPLAHVSLPCTFIACLFQSRRVFQPCFCLRRRVFPSPFHRVGGFSFWYLGEIVKIWRRDVAKITERLYKVEKSTQTVSFLSEGYPRTDGTGVLCSI